MVKIHALKKKLSLLQKQNQIMSFMLCKETVQDFMKHTFDSEPDEKNMMCGFTPFCLQQMDKACNINLEKIEECIATQMYTSSTDLLKWEQALKFMPI